MLRKLRLLYYNNKEKIWVAIGIIVFVIVIIQIINYNIKKNREEEFKNNNISSTTNETYLPSQKSSVISDTDVSEEDLKEDTSIIEEFVNYCNSNNIEGAYNLLSQDCKDEMFPTIDRFYEIYIQDIFTEKRNYDLETWSATPGRVTYRIKYQNDIMGTGIINEEFMEDYITVIEENDEKKLNIKEFINKVDVNESSEINGLEVTVVAKYYYYDDEQVDITFKNNTNGQVVLDSKKNTESVYIKDENGIKYPWFGNEIPNENLILEVGESITLRLKFNKLYNENRVDDTINFTDILINNEIVTLEVKI